MDRFGSAEHPGVRLRTADAAVVLMDGLRCLVLYAIAAVPALPVSTGGGAGTPPP